MKFIIFLLFFISPLFAQNESTLLSQPAVQAPEGFESDIRNTNEAPANFESTPDSRGQEFETYEDIKKVAQQNELYKKYRLGFSSGASYGQRDALPYTEIYFSPYLKLDQFFFQYDIPLRFDWTQSFIKETWTRTPALISKIEMDLYYAKTNHWFREFRTSIYAGESLYLGHGRFLHDYNPNLLAPWQTYKTAYLSMNLSYFGIKAYVANIANPNIIGGEIYLRPLAGLKNPKNEFYQDLKIYGVFGMDLQPFQQASSGIYTLGVSPNGAPRFNMVEAGLDLPLYRTPKKIFEMSLYFDYAQFLAQASQNVLLPNTPSGGGFSVGAIFGIAQQFFIHIGISQAIGTWTPRWIDEFYTIDQSFLLTDTTIYVNKYYNVPSNLTYFDLDISYRLISRGIYSSISLFGDISSQNLSAKFSLQLTPELFSLLSFEFSWILRNLYTIGNILAPRSSILALQLRYHMQPNMTWGFLMKINGTANISFQEDSEQLNDQQFISLGLNFDFRF